MWIVLINYRKCLPDNIFVEKEFEYLCDIFTKYIYEKDDSAVCSQKKLENITFFSSKVKNFISERNLKLKNDTNTQRGFCLR